MLTSALDPVWWTPESLEAKPPERESTYRTLEHATAVQLARSYPEKSISRLSWELGISDQTLHNWVKQAQIDRGEREVLILEERQELCRSLQRGEDPEGRAGDL